MTSNSRKVEELYVIHGHSQNVVLLLLIYKISFFLFFRFTGNRGHQENGFSMKHAARHENDGFMVRIDLGGKEK